MRMMRTVFFMIGCFCCQFFVNAQTTISGNIVLNNGEKAVGVTIQLRPLNITTYSNEDGDFKFANIANGSYTISAAAVGLQAQEQTITLVSGKKAVLNFNMIATTNTLNEVVVYGSNRYFKNAVSSSFRTAVNPFEAPQQIQIISNKLIKDQQAFTPTDLARNVSGVSSIFPFPGVYTDFNIRGTRATQGKFRNGMNMGIASFGLLQEDMSYTERVEFIKGPSGFLIGQGEPGGVFNVDTKKPLPYTIANLNFTTGSFNLFRLHADFGGALDKKKKLLFRMNVMAQDNHTHIQNQKNKRLSIAPVLSYTIGEKTTITAEYNYDAQKTNGLDMAVPSINGKFELPRNFNISGLDSKLSFEQQYAFFKVEHAINSNWKLTAQTSYNEGFIRGFDIQSRGRVLANDSSIREARYWNNIAYNYNGQLFVNGTIKLTKQIENNLYMAVDWGEQSFKRLGITGANSSIRNLPIPLSLRNPNYIYTDQNIQNFLPPVANMTFQVPAITKFKAINLYNTTKFNKYVQLNWGGRFNWIETGTTILKADKKFSPRVGLSIFPVKNVNLYALYDATFLPLAGRDFAGNEFVPQQGINKEFGVKIQWFKGALSSNIAVFDIVKTNGLTADPINNGFQVQQLEVRSKGIEIDIVGSPLKSINIIANYAYTDSRISKDRINSLIVGRWEQAPLHNANIWIKKTVLNGKLKGLGLATGYSFMSERNTLTIGLTNKTQQVQLPNYKRLDAAVSYDFKKYLFALNIENLTNAQNIFGTYDIRGNANVYNYLTTPGMNWRFTIGVRL
ncbi:MAG: hypothetical protein EAZ35_03655 [Sphingobacteriia bacterium]|nr:MAG: hypothetical protein EAZ35_03655 [Sphingobacteriia bacterium]